MGASSEETTLLIAEAVGRSAEGERLVDDLDAYLADQRDSYPRFGRKTANYLDVGASSIASYSQDHIVNRVLYEVG